MVYPYGIRFNNNSLEQEVYEALDDLQNTNVISDVVLGDTESKAKKLWKMREDIPEANRKLVQSHLMIFHCHLKIWKVL